MKLKKSMLLITTGLIAVSCGHHRDVRPGVRGIHTVKVESVDTESGSRDAAAQANHFCEERGLTAAFVKEQSKYQGDMDEQTYKIAKKASTTAQFLGGATSNPRP